MLKARIVLATVLVLAATPVLAQPTAGLLQGAPSLPGLSGLVEGTPNPLMNGGSSSLAPVSGDGLLVGLPGLSGADGLSDMPGLPGDSGAGALPLPGLGDGSVPSGDGNSGGPVVLEQRDEGLLLGVRLNGRDGILHDDIVPFLGVDATLLSSGGLHALVYGEESDDWLRLEALLSPEQTFVDIEGYGDDRIDTETDRELFGLLN